MYNQSIDLSCDGTGKECLPDLIADEYWIKASVTDDLIEMFYWNVKLVFFR